MNTYEWSLDALYTGYDDPIFQQDLTKLKALLPTLQTFAKKMDTLEDEQVLLQGITLLEEEKEISYRLRMYTILRQSIDTTHKDTLQYSNIIQLASNALTPHKSAIYEYISNIEHIETYLEKDEKLKSYSFLLHNLQNGAKHALTKEEEGLLSSLNQTSKQAFSDMYYYLSAKVSTTCLDKQMTLTQVKNLCHHMDKEVRKQAFQCEMKCYESIKDPLAFAVNNIKRQQMMEAKLRGYHDPLEKMLADSYMQRETLDAMYQAIDKYLPKFHEYLRTKASILGYDNGLPWYDIYATIGKSDMTFHMEDCNAYILKHFKTFSKDLYDMSKRAMDEHWMDYPSHAGKQSGAYCENLPWIKQSRIITNYGDTLSDVITVAHELGHAYHGMMVENKLPLNRDYCMPLAETASTFNENIMYNALFQDANDENKLFLMDTQLSALCQNICDITTRFTFEKAIFDTCEERFLFAEDLQNIMIEAEKKCFGNGLDPDWLHPYRWITKVHYYIPDIAYYNFPYTFGALFSRGLYAMYEEEKEAFLPKYRALLQASTTHTVEETARIAGIDLSKPDFWEASLQSITKQMDTFLKLVKEAKLDV